MRGIVSYASLERVEGDYAVCEVEQLSVLDSQIGDFNKQCYMVNIPIEMFVNSGVSMLVGKVYSVVHDGPEVFKIIRIEKEETKRRKEWLKSLGK